MRSALLFCDDCGQFVKSEIPDVPIEEVSFYHGSCKGMQKPKCLDCHKGITGRAYGKLLNRFCNSVCSNRYNSRRYQRTRHGKGFNENRAYSARRHKNQVTWGSIFRPAC